ncbi:hypothetical protein [Sphingobacterium siyangense]|jgi:uncharacterized phage-associated protein|uniref:hypothetical protein n=1 Tax=Sphingobacterium siyangense TaxID=459529 RepID=UPI0028A86376|nr:hypothetical protein [Sphingobacterium siyangense]
MERDQKILATKYMFFSFLKWYGPLKEHENDLSLLKVLKLIFFTCSISSKYDDNLLSRGFNFAAMPFGHVESQVYDFYKEGVFANIIDTKHIVPNTLSENLFTPLNLDLRLLIDTSINDLISTNCNLIYESASALVNLSHKHSSWINNFNLAKAHSQYSQPINNQEIINEEKFYFA